MHRTLAFLVLTAATAAPASAAERTVAVTNFERIRVDGPFEVQLTTRQTPRATVSGDARALDLVDVRVDGGTLIVRAANGGWGERPAARGVSSPVIRLQTRDLRSASVVGSGKLSISGPVAADRVDLNVTGAGLLAADGVAAGQLTTTLIGTGQVQLSGTTRTARIVGNGAGTIAARGLTAGDVTIRTEGTTTVSVTARFTAAAFSTGLGPIEILGKPECKGKAQAGGVIVCGGKPL